MKQAGSILIILVFIAIILLIMKNENAKQQQQPKIFYSKKLLGNYNGYIVPPFGVFIKESEKDNQALIEHELMHWKQFQRDGLIPFLVNYSKEAFQKGYDKNPYEIEARTQETDFCKENYTECVRQCISNTVCNPQFRT